MSGVYEFSAQRYGETPSQAVIHAVAAVENLDPTDLPPLFSSIDPLALNSLFAEEGSRTGKVVFPYNGYRITVHADTSVTVEPA